MAARCLQTLKNVPEVYKTLYAFNPMVGVIEGVRWSLFGPEAAPEPFAVVLAPVLIAVMFASGLWYFWKTERTFADLI